MMKDDKKFKIKLVLLWVFAFSVMIFIMSMSVNAEEPYFPMEQNKNNAFPDVVKDAIDNRFDTENNFVFFYTNDINNDGWTRGWVGVIEKNNQETPYFYGEIQNNGYIWNAYSLFNTQIACYKVNANRSTGLLGVTWQGYNQGVFLNMLSSNYTTTTDFISNFRIYTSNLENAEVVLRYGSDPVPPLEIGTAIIPPAALVPEYLSGDTAPTNVPPSYTVNNYNWTTAPTFDGSSVINGIQSIKDTLDWLSSNLHNEIVNLVVNIKGLAEYIGKTIQYYGNMLVETINNLIQNLYDNMKALVEPIYTKLENFYNDFLEFADLFIHPFDQEEFAEQMESCELINQYEELMDNCEVIQQIFDYAEERDYFVLYIDFENPFADSEHKIIHSQISFNWLVPLRSVYRPFLWTFTLFECFVGGMRILGNIIGGKAK